MNIIVEVIITFVKIGISVIALLLWQNNKY
jgi:hypothetical protein